MCPADDSSDDPDPDASRVQPPSPADKVQAATALTVRELVLFAGELLPPTSVARVLALKEAAIEPLLAILGDRKLRDPGGLGGGWGPVHAAGLLGQLGAPRAIEPLLDTLATTFPPEELCLAVSQALLPLGAALIIPILARLPTAVGPYRRELWFLLAGAQVRDARIFDQLLEAFAEQPEEGVMRLAEYGDPAALPYLARALDTYRPGLADDTSDDQMIFELREAIHSLGGTLTPEQESKYEQARFTRKVTLSVRRARRPPPDPDAPCPCKSGRPYRSCCLH